MKKEIQHIPSGYKPSPLGPIPEDWEVKRLGEVCTFLDSQRIPIKDADRGKMQGKYPYYGASGIIDYVNDYIFDDDLILLGEDGANIITRSTPLAFLVSGKVWINNHAHVLKTNEGYNRSYICNYLESLSYDKYNTGTAQPKLNQEVCEHIPVLIPSEDEQNKISDLLTLWDTAITKQSALIEKLTLRKRGLMQQLLTEKKRLKGFGGEWKEVRLGEIGKFVGGCAFNEQEQGGQTGIPFYKVSDMNLPGNESKMNIANNYVTHEQIERLGYIVIENEAIIFAKVGAAIALERKRYAKNFIIDNNMLAYLPNNNVWYMKYWFDSISLSKYIQVGALPSYNASDLSIIKLKMPSLKEQNAIASVLVNADKEIEIQKQKLAAMQAQKKGLMQVLLTGKRRVTI